MEEGQAITIIPASHELTSQDAADLLGVSREYMVRLLQGGKLAFHRAGTHRRIYLQDLMAYKKERDRQRREALDQMAREEVEAGTYDVFVLSEEWGHPGPFWMPAHSLTPRFETLLRLALQGTVHSVLVGRNHQRSSADTPAEAGQD